MTGLLEVRQSGSIDFHIRAGAGPVNDFLSAHDYLRQARFHILYRRNATPYMSHELA